MPTPTEHEISGTVGVVLGAVVASLAKTLADLFSVEETQKSLFGLVQTTVRRPILPETFWFLLGGAAIVVGIVEIGYGFYLSGKPTKPEPEKIVVREIIRTTAPAASASSALYCYKCGTANLSDAKFCQSCGTGLVR